MAWEPKDHLSAELLKSASLLKIETDDLKLNEQLVNMSMLISNGPAENPFPELKKIADELTAHGQSEQVSVLLKAIEDYRADKGSFW